MSASTRKTIAKPIERISTTRGPNYPHLTLPKAIDKARVILQELGRHATGKAVLAGIWGMTSSSSSFRHFLAAVRAFGLLDEVTGREEPLVKLSDRALDILADYPEGDPRRQEAIRDAALAPQLHAELWSQYGAEMPADSEIRRFLVRVRNFTDKSVDTFIQQYKATLEFAGLIGPDRAEVEPDRVIAGTAPKLAVGDLAQWSSQGVDQFPEPRCVVRFAEDGSHAFVEGSMTGLPVHQLSVAQPPVGGTAETPLPPGMRQEVFPIQEGDVILRMPNRLSASSYEDMEEWLILVLRKAWRLIEDAEGGSPKPPRRVKLENTQAPKR